MRIGIDIRYVAASGPGQQRYLWRLAHVLADRGHDVHVLTTYTVDPEESEHASVSVTSLVGMGRDQRLQAVRALELDVFFANPERARHYAGLPMHVMRPGYGTRQGRQRMRSLSPGLQSLGYRIFRAMPWVQAKMRAEAAWYRQTRPRPWVVANSRLTRRYVMQDYAFPEERIRVIRNGVDLHDFNPQVRRARRVAARTRYGLSPDDRVLGFVGHNFRLKGLWELLASTARLKGLGRNFRLLAAGKGTGGGQWRAAQKRVRDLGLGATVTLPGGVEDVRWVYAAADAMAFPSWHDSFGFVVLEAAAMGLPVITTRFAGASEVFEDCEGAWILDRPDDAKALDRAVEDVLKPDEQGQRGKAALAVAQQYDEASSLADLAALIEEVGAEPG